MRSSSWTRNTGRIIAAASYPTYNPQQFVGGISQRRLRRADRAERRTTRCSAARSPASTRPGSTFKLITVVVADVTHNEISLNGTYPCPGSLTIDGRVKTNYDSESFGYPLDARRTRSGYSCDTFFYAPAATEYYADQARIAAGKKPTEYLQQMAAAYGVGRAPGIDLPADEQATGSYADRETRLARWNANKAAVLRGRQARLPERAERGPAGVPDRSWPRRTAPTAGATAPATTPTWRSARARRRCRRCSWPSPTRRCVNGGKIWEPDPRLGASSTAAARSCKTINPTRAQHGPGQRRRC